MFGKKKEILKITVEGMHCMHCVCRVETAIRAVKGVKEVDIELENGAVTVEYIAGKVNLHDIYSAVKNAGFDVKE